ncbi:MAG: DUF1501 domain-containing protein [Pedosphaera sp.]|nr:DUF1501 domain-containing protein [Pedosphaera sp.]MSU43615.1 DUF1501 domain-containing protein [Pedosphaera sp.]
MSEVPHLLRGSPHAFAGFHPRVREGLTVTSRRGMLKAGLAGFAGLNLPRLLQAREEAARAGRYMDGNRAVILLWMAGGPSHIDTLDPKPDRPENNRGPFDVIPTTHPGVMVCEHLPKYAKLTDKLTLIRSVDCRQSNHQPNTVMQTGVRAAEPRLNREAHLYPGIASMVAKWRGANHPALPPAVSLNVRDRTHFAWSGWLGDAHEPLVGDNTARLFQLTEGLSLDRLQDRRTLAQQMDRVRTQLDQSGAMDSLDRYGQRAYELVAGGRARTAFDLSKEPKAMLDRYGPHEWAQKALLARRLVEAGVSFVTLDLSHHRASGTWDTHGDKFPPYGGIVSGLRPLLPVFDHLFTTLVRDLDERGSLRDVLVIAMGEFGRSPEMGTQGSPDGRNHWPEVMSMTLAGGRFRHGQVIGATDKDGGQIKERPVTPGDLAATIFHHFGVPLDATYPDHRGRPRYIVEQGEPIRELI